MCDLTGGSMDGTWRDKEEREMVMRMKREWWMAALAATVCVSSACGADSNMGAYFAPGAPPASAEVYDEVVENDFVETSEEAISTFSVDVDTASYTLMRRDVQSGRLPAREGVRPEEYINYFDYPYPQPEGEHPFSINLEVAPSKFGEGKHLMRVGLQGKKMTIEDLKPTNLVFLIDVSGSMQSSEKLPLVEKSLYTLIDHLRPTDTVSIVTYAGDDRVVLEPTEVSRKRKIKRAIRRLSWGGSTNAEAGIVRAYELAEQARIEGGNNRVVILTDGDFNVGKTGEELIALIEQYRAREISLTCMGYGLGNYNDYHMENLSNKGNGNYFYVDSEQEAERVFGKELASTLEVIAADVKIQVEFNEEAVKSYRLLGYENRVLDNTDFDDDAKDAGEIGPGHTVTAYYELELAEGSEEQAVLSDVRVRYKSQYGVESKLIERAIKMSNVQPTFEGASKGFRFGAVVAEFAEIMRESMHLEGGVKQWDALERELDEVMSRSDSKQVEFESLVERARGL